MDGYYWYGLKSEVYVHLYENEVLVYDTNQKICKISKDKWVIKLIKTAEEENSLGCVLIDENWQKPSVQKWIKLTCKERMAVVFPYYRKKEHPVILRPLLSLNKDVDKIKDERFMSFYWGGNVKHFLNSLNIYLNTNCSNRCPDCKNYCRQFLFCTNYGGKTDYSITPRMLESILSELNCFPLKTVNIFGGDIYDRKLLNLLENATKQYSLCFRFYVHYQNYRTHTFVDSQEVHLLIPANFDISCLVTTCSQLKDNNKVLHFVIEKKEDIQVAEEFINNNGIALYNIHPFYTGKNESFFKENVYMRKSELVNIKLSMREIFRNKKLNANYFGVLYIMPDGSIKTQIDRQTLGLVGQDELIDVIYKELITNTAWRHIRGMKPCSKCVFQYLCPPPSNYETIIGKNNLCYLRNNKFSV